MEDYIALREHLGIEAKLSKERMRWLVDNFFGMSKEGERIRVYYGLSTGNPINDYDRLGEMFFERPGQVRKGIKKSLKKFKARF